MRAILRFCHGGQRAVSPVDDDQPRLFPQHFIEKLQGLAFGQQAVRYSLSISMSCDTGPTSVLKLIFFCVEPRNYRGLRGRL